MDPGRRRLIPGVQQQATPLARAGVRQAFAQSRACFAETVQWLSGGRRGFPGRAAGPPSLRRPGRRSATAWACHQHAFPSSCLKSDGSGPRTVMAAVRRAVRDGLRGNFCFCSGGYPGEGAILLVRPEGATLPRPASRAARSLHRPRRWSMTRQRKIWSLAALGSVAALVLSAGAAQAALGSDVRLTNDAPGTGGYVSDFTMVTGHPYTDPVLTTCSQSRGRQNEPAVAVDPRNPQVVVGSSNDYCGVFRSDGSLLGLGNVWLATYQNPQGPSGPSVNDGKQFARSLDVAQGSAAPNLLGKFHDKTAIEVDRTGGACDGTVYFAWARFTGNPTNGDNSSVYIVRSTDHGATFS